MSDTIAALSSAPGKAGIAVVRVSGDDAIAVTKRVFTPLSGDLDRSRDRSAAYGAFCDTDGRRFDTGLVTCFFAPRSYTGEDTAELSLHGSPVGVSTLLAALYACGARPALPGEFTRRAFSAGKLDLTQAEAVGALLDAQTAAELRLSASQLDGTLGKAVRKQSDRLKAMLAAVYAYIDYPDEDMSDMTDDEIKREIAAVAADLRTLHATYAGGMAVTKGVDTVIAGLPNTGKSTLFNRLAGADRAIVTDVAGTTRDVLRETVLIGDIKLRLADTAGLRETDETVERIGVARTKEALEESKLILALVDASSPASKEETAFLRSLLPYRGQKYIVVVLNKADKADEETLAKRKTAVESMGLTETVVLSAKSGDLCVLERALQTLFPVSGEELEQGLVLVNARQYAAVSKALAALDRALVALDTLTRDVAGFDLEEALGALEEADGRTVSSSVVDEIFSRFCVGK